jgi:hypothetical protein
VPGVAGPPQIHCCLAACMLPVGRNAGGSLNLGCACLRFGLGSRLGTLDILCSTDRRFPIPG